MFFLVLFFSSKCNQLSPVVNNGSADLTLRVCAVSQNKCEHREFHQSELKNDFLAVWINFWSVYLTLWPTELFLNSSSHDILCSQAPVCCNGGLKPVGAARVWSCVCDEQNQLTAVVCVAFRCWSGPTTVFLWPVAPGSHSGQWLRPAWITFLSWEWPL